MVGTSSATNTRPQNRKSSKRGVVAVSDSPRVDEGLSSGQKPAGIVSENTETLPGFTAQQYRATQQANQLPGDRQPQSGPTVLARRTPVGLGEGIENRLLLLGRNTDARVLDIETQTGIVAITVEMDTNVDVTGLRELDRVTDEIHQTLTQTSPRPYAPDRAHPDFGRF